MRLLRQQVGIDVAADTLYVYFQQQAENLSLKCKGRRKFDNTAKGHSQLLDWINKRLKSDGPVQCVMEATGVYHESLAYYLYEASCPVVIVLPNRIKAYARSLNNYSKTDRIDAQMIARYAAFNCLDNWSPPSPRIRHLRFLTREHQQLTQERTQVKNQYATHSKAAYPNANTLNRMKRRIEFVDQQIQEIERELAELSANDRVLSRGVEVLTSIPGIGTLTACKIMAETDCFALFANRRQVIKYAGLDVIERQSGTSVKGKARVSKRGNSYLRSAMFMPAKCVSRTKGKMRQLYERHYEKYDNYNKALMPIQRKLLLLAYALLKKDELYDPAYETSWAKQSRQPSQTACSSSCSEADGFDFQK